MYTTQHTINSHRYARKRNSYQNGYKSINGSKNHKKPLPEVKIDLGNNYPISSIHTNLTMSSVHGNHTRRNQHRESNVLSELRQEVQQLRMENQSLKQQNKQYKITQELLNKQISQLKQQKVDFFTQEQYARAIAQETISKYSQKIKQLYQQLICQKKKNHCFKKPLQQRNQRYQKNGFHSGLTTQTQHPNPIWAKIQLEGEKAYYSSFHKKMKQQEDNYYVRTYHDINSTEYLGEQDIKGNF